LHFFIRLAGAINNGLAGATSNGLARSISNGLARAHCQQTDRLQADRGIGMSGRGGKFIDC
jgi:hypothetical protein